MAKLNLTDITTGYFSAAAYNANNALIEAAMEKTLSRDGTSPNTMSVDIDMNSNRVTNLLDAVNNQDAVTLAQLNSASLAAIAELDDLSDVTVTAPVAGEVLRYSGTQWVDVTLGLSDLTEVAAGSPVEGNALTYRSGQWVADSPDIAVGDNEVITFGDGGDVTLGYTDPALDFTIDAATFATDVFLNLNASGNFHIQEAGGDRIKLDIFQGFLEIHDGFRLRMYEQAEIDYLDIYHNGTNVIFDESAGGNFFFEGGGNLLLREGGIFAVYDASNADNVAFSHDGSNFQVSATEAVGTTDWHFNDFAAININNAGSLLLNAGGVINIRSPDDLSYAQFNMSNADVFGIVNGLNGQDADFVAWTNVNVRDGAQLRVYDSGDTDFMAFYHDGTDFFVQGTSTGQVQCDTPWLISTTSGAFTSAQLTLQGDAATVKFYDDGATVDNGRWTLGYASEAFRLRAWNDAETVSADAMIVERTGTTIDEIEFLGDVHLDDNINLVFGTGDDVTVDFNGTNLLWTVGTNEFIINRGGTNVFRTDDHDASGVTSGTSTVDHLGTFYQVGWNEKPQRSFNSAFTLAAEHAGKISGKTTTTARTITLPGSGDTDFPVDSEVTLVNVATSGNLTINASTNSATLYWLDGSTRAGGASTNRTVGPGGSVTLRRQSTTTWWIWGGGIS